jgi:hypothetical protein
MNGYARFLLCLGFGFGVLVAADWLVPGWFAKVGLDSGSLLELFRAQHREELRREELAARDRYYLDNLEGKRAVVCKLLERELSLREAADRFQSLNAACPDYDWEAFRAAFPGQDDEERHCRQVLAAVRMQVGPESGPGRELIAELEIEMERCCHAH